MNSLVTFPLVSVIIRSMDRPTLADALDSVALQTYSNIEVIVVNAKGADHSEIAEWCGRFPMRMTDNNEPLRRSKAANLGIESAKGKYFIFLDDDDWFNSEHLHVLTKLLENEERAVAAYSGVRCLHFNGVKKEEVRIFNEPFDATKLLFENYIPIHAILIRKFPSNAELKCQFDETFDLFEDWDFLLQLMAQGSFLYHPDITANYRIHGNSGEGVDTDPKKALEAFNRIVEKWRSLWTTKQMMDMIARGRLLENLLVKSENTREENKKIITELTTKLTANKHQLEDCKHQLDLVLNSRSWHLTAPLRWLTKKIIKQV